jgi:TolB protein
MIRLKLTLLGCFIFATAIARQREIPLHKDVQMGNTEPTWVSIAGISGEALQVLQFDLFIQGFNFTNAANAQYQITGKANGNFQAQAITTATKHSVVSKAYSGASLRRQVHAFADDFAQALSLKPICQTKMAFKGITGQNSEVFLSDFDGSNVQPVTQDNTIVAAPDWAPGHNGVYYVSYKRYHADIIHQTLASGARRVFAGYGGSNMSPAASPDGSKVAMILSKDGWTDLYVGSASGGLPKRLTNSPQDESSPCWSPDSHWICYASKDKERRALRKISPSGGESRVIATPGIPNPTEPDWSPDGKWIAFTSQAGSLFQICVVGADGGETTTLVEGEDPSWSPNSRTLIAARRTDNGYVLFELDVLTKQHRDISRITGSKSQSQPSWAR